MTPQEFRSHVEDSLIEMDAGDVDLETTLDVIHDLHKQQQWSNVSIGDKRLTWRELAERRQDEIRGLQRFATLVADLDRNEHGRHEGDVDGAGVSDGNPHVRPGEVLGYSIHGTHEYRMPERGRRHDADAWAVPVESVS